MAEKSRNSELLADFVSYCETHPTERFWQALRNWSGHKFILTSTISAGSPEHRDTFFWEGKDK